MAEIHPEKSSRIFDEKCKWAAWTIICLGTLVRLVQYIHYRPLWTDEAWYGANIFTMSYKELFGPLVFGANVAPPFFLHACKISVAAFGVNEYAVRLVPFISGIAVLVLSYLVSRKILSALGCVLALAFVAVCAHLINYSAELRQYSTDAAVCLLMLWLALRVEKGRAPALIALAVAGALAPWFSYPIVFIMAAIAATQLVAVAYAKDWKMVSRLVCVYAVWAIGCSLFYFIHVRAVMASSNGLRNLSVYSYASAFWPLPPKNLTQIRWPYITFMQMFDNPGGLTLTGLAAFAFLAGCVSLSIGKKKYLSILLLPFVLALVASALELYPFYKRTILYCAPLVLMLAGEGVAMLIRETQGRNKLAGVLLFALLILHPGLRAARMVVQPTTHHELHAVLDHVEENWKDGDTLYLPHNPGLAFIYCKWRYEFPEEAYITAPKRSFEGKRRPELRKIFIDEQMRGLEGKGRVWIATTYDLRTQPKAFVDSAKKYSQYMGEFHAIGAVVHLFDFSENGA